MKLKDAIIIAKKYSNVIFLNTVFSPVARSLIISSSLFVLMVSFASFILLVVGSNYTAVPIELTSFSSFIFSHKELYFLATLFSFAIFIFSYSLELYSRYFLRASIGRVFSNNDDRVIVSYEASKVLLFNENEGFVKKLVNVPESNFMMNRLCISPEEVVESTLGVVISSDDSVALYNDTVTLGSLWKVLYEHSEDLQKCLLAKKIQKEIYFNTCDWLDKILEEEKRSGAWWWRENLSKTRGIGKSLSYGDVYFIGKYARELAFYEKVDEVGNVILHKNSVIQLEETLSKIHGANAVIVGESGTGKHAIVKILSRMIEQGDCYSEIEYKRVFEFDNTILGALCADELVSVLTHCFNEALTNRNIIFVINDISTLFDMLEKQGVDLFQVIERYVGHPHVSIVCISDQSFYQHEKHKAMFDKDFEVIHIEDMNSALLIPYVEDHAVIVEKNTGKFFSAHAVHTIATALSKYFVEDSPLVKTDELLYKIATNSAESGHIVLNDESVSNVIREITGVTTGEIQEDEKEKLLTLESTLNKKVMGQNEALKVVASTMRRSRAGLSSGKKPIGSFLFLGPTGVGKTETAKALAEVFFGSEDHMSRIDMNEYTMSNSSYRLLGDENQEGDIAKCIHGRPYGVLLLDEFEKATTEVKDIFLRVLDEGVFTNGAGKKISARIQIIVATSNAGSDYIRESGLNPDSTKEEIKTIKSKLLDVIIAEGLFRPELINRFDAVVVFNPLGEDSKVAVARKMFEALKERSLSEGYDVSFTDALVQKITDSEEDSMFGGRAIQRKIQTDVEEALARKIIEGSLETGGAIVINAEDIE